MEQLSPLFYWIRIGLFSGSVLLLAGALLGMLFRTDSMTDAVAHLNRDKRRSRRFRSDLIIEMDRAGAPVKVLNISEQGACFVTTAGFRTGEIVRGILLSPRSTRLNVSGRVVWARQQAEQMLYGVRFDKPVMDPA